MYVETSVKCPKMQTAVTDFAEPGISAQRAALDGEMEESASHHIQISIFVSSNCNFCVNLEI